MKTLHRITTVALGASIALTPMLAFAQTNTQDQNDLRVERKGFLSGFLNRNDERKAERMDREERSSDEASSSEKMHAMKDKKPEHMEKGLNLQARADASIDGRVTALQTLSSRITASATLSADEKASFTAMLQAQITALTALKVQIGNDTSTSSMRDDVGKIRPEFRTYALVLPRTSIVAASDRILSVVSQMETVGTKLNARIDAATSSANVAAARTSYADYVAKLADAKVQAQAAANLVANLTPDNGDKTIFASNTAALKAAKVKLDAARADLKTARKDMNDIFKALKIEHSDEVHASSTSR